MAAPIDDSALAQPTSPIEALFRQPPSDLDMRSELLGVISNTTHSLDMAAFTLDEPEVIQALNHAEARGVQVHIVADSPLPPLVLSPTIVYVTSTSTALLHDKFLILDGATVWTGSANFSKASLQGTQANDAVILPSPAAAAIYGQEFARLFNDGDFGKQKCRPPAGFAHLLPGTVGTTNVDIAFGPQDTPERLLINRIRQANHTISATLDGSGLTNARLMRELADASRRSVSVSVVTDANPAAARTLCRAGIKVWNATSKVHSKSMVVDGGDPGSARVVTGSANWSQEGLFDNDENLIVIRSAEVARAYSNNHRALLLTATSQCAGNVASFSIFLPLVPAGPLREGPLMIDDIQYQTGCSTDWEWVRLRSVNSKAPTSAIADVDVDLADFVLADDELAQKYHEDGCPPDRLPSFPVAAGASVTVVLAAQPAASRLPANTVFYRLPQGHRLDDGGDAAHLVHCPDGLTVSSYGW